MATGSMIRSAFPNLFTPCSITTWFRATGLIFKKFLNLNYPDVACGFRAMKLGLLEDYPADLNFGIIYEMLIRHANSGGLTGFVKIPAIYHAHDPLNTKIAEITGLVTAIIKYNPAPELSEIMDSLKRKTDFRINLFDLLFEARFDQHDAYVFQKSKNKSKAEV
jgi:hypothetical protein